MRGLDPNQMPMPQQGAAPGGQPAGAMPPGEMQGGPSTGQKPGAAPATPEEQAAYDAFMGLFMTTLYDDATMPTVIEMMRKAPTPMEGASRAVVMIGVRVLEAAKEAGDDVPLHVVMHAGLEAVALVAELAAAAGAPQMSAQQIEATYFLAADKFGAVARQRGLLEVSPDDIDVEGMEQLAAETGFEEHLRGVAAGMGGAG